jgi:hypothetical protein
MNASGFSFYTARPLTAEQQQVQHAIGVPGEAAEAVVAFVCGGLGAERC